jgi:formiminotetrahydrofolate cyclodeaminase
MLSHKPLNQFLDMLAGPTATPGGGSAAAAAGAMGAALVSMVCRLTIGREKFAAAEPQLQEALTQSETLRATLIDMIQKDGDAFETLMAAYRLPKTTEAEKAARSAAIQAGYKAATLAPLETARTCAQLIRLAQVATQLGNPNAASDGGVGVLCAQTGLKGAALNVLINLDAITDETFTAQCRADLVQILDASDTLAAEIYRSVKNKL